MRTMTVVAALSIAAIVTACGTIVETDGVRVRCRDKEANVINLMGRLEVRPERIEVCRGYSVTLRFRNTVPAGRARTRQSATGADWLNVENTSTEQIVIAVPSDAARTEVKYTLEIDGLGLLDPRIVIQ